MLYFTDFSSLFDKVDLRIKAWDIKISFLCWQASIEITSVFFGIQVYCSLHVFFQKGCFDH